MLLWKLSTAMIWLSWTSSGWPIISLSTIGRLFIPSCLLAAFCLAVFPTEACAGFITAPAYAAGPSPFSVGVGDFNRDGIPDIAVVGAGTSPNYTDGSVSILLGNGDGTFQPARSYATGIYSDSVVVGDLNRDGFLDLVVANSSGTVSILLGNGDGTFQPAQSYAAGPTPWSVAMGDFNGDGIPDLAVTNNTYEGTVSILLGNDDGTFGAAQSYPAGSEPLSVAVGDFNGDGNLDLAATADTGVNILLGKGDGSFGTLQSYAIPGGAYSLAVAEFRHNDIVDIVVANGLYGSPGTVSILLGSGDGSFQAVPVSYAIGFGVRSVGLGDFNGDGNLDIAAGGGNGVSILLGNGDGSFQTVQSYAIDGSDANTSPVGVADFNGDSILDLAVANFGSNTVTLLLGRGDGSFRAAPTYAVDGNPVSVAVGDLNGDGILDLAVANRHPGTVTILRCKADGTFDATAGFATPYIESIMVADVNRDGKPDIVTTNFGYILDPRHGITFIESEVQVLLGNGDGTFRTAQRYATGRGPSAVKVADLNGDGIPDLVVVNGGDQLVFGDNTLSVLLGNGDGTFQSAQSYAAGSYPRSVAVGDFNGDGVPDIAVANYTNPGTVTILLGKGDGTFLAPQNYEAGPDPLSLVVGDFNGDGIPDLAVANNADPGTVSVLLGNGNGTFQAPQNYAVASFPVSIAAGDFNGDGHLDLVVANNNPYQNFHGTVGILLGNGDGTFQVAQNYAAGGGLSSLAVGDLNGDGFPDIVAANGNFSTTVTTLLNAADWGGGH